MTPSPETGLEGNNPTFLGNRKRANLSASVVFAVVLIVGLILVISHPGIESPTTTTKVVKPATEAARTHQRVITVTHSGGEKRSTTDVTTMTKEPAKAASTEKTTVKGQRSTVERVLGNGGVVLLQLAVVLFAAFIAAAAAQRVVMGQYGGVKAGTFGIDELAESSTEGLVEIRNALAKEHDATARELKDLKKRLNATRAQVDTTTKAVDTANKEGLRTDSTLSEQLAFLTKRLANLESATNKGTQ